MSFILYLLCVAKDIFTLDVLNTYAGKYNVAISNDVSIPFGNFGVSDGTPFFTIKTPSLSKNNLSILGK